MKYDFTTILERYGHDAIAIDSLLIMLAITARLKEKKALM